jgi:hypothetical protein
MGQRYCQAPVLPTKPIVHPLISNEGCTAFSEGQFIDITNHICFSPDDVKVKEMWIRDVLRACGN